jgi:GNAT superfamily N-acetyltransferase
VALDPESTPEPARIVFYSWWQSDLRMALPPLPGLTAGISADYRLIAELARLDVGEVLNRVKSGHRPYVAHFNGTPVAYGWSASEVASIGEIGLTFGIPRGNRYLWDFATLPPWRGRGIYPRLLQTILQLESVEAERFWIGHLPANLPSARGIAAAGFRYVGTIGPGPGGQPGFAPAEGEAHAQAAAVLLHTPVQEVERRAA